MNYRNAMLTIIMLAAVGCLVCEGIRTHETIRARKFFEKEFTSLKTEITGQADKGNGLLVTFLKWCGRMETRALGSSSLEAELTGLDCTKDEQLERHLTSARLRTP